jgi:quercetin dioxygenase-like cupin family protein
MNFRWYRSGDLFGIRYEMHRGEEIPEHAHLDAEMQHNIIVLRGTVHLKVQGCQGLMLTEGTIRDFHSEQPHSIMCMSDSAITLHMFLRGIPAGYAELPESEHQGTL